jgi:hypothetical protein
MLEIFFGDGQPHDKSAILDSRTGNLGGWTRADFANALNVHQRAFGPYRTGQALVALFGTSDPTRIPSYAYGQIIGALTAEMACGQPHHIPRSPIYAGRKS